jgi:hypothetical protein
MGRFFFPYLVEDGCLSVHGTPTFGDLTVAFLRLLD